MIAWQKSQVLVKTIYQATESFPKEEIYGITGQIRRAVISIPANIAEGHARFSQKEYAQFVSISYASATELETLIYLAGDINLLKQEECSKLIADIQEILKIVGSLRIKLREEAD